jgi:hypothetical protein
MSDELFDKIIADVISKNTFIQTKRAEMEKLRLEEEERQKEADRLERERVAEESRKLQDKVDKMNEQVFSFRLKQLQQVAQVVFDKDVVTVFGNVLGNKEYVYSLPDEEFDTVLADLTKKAEQKAEEEKEKAAREAKLKERVNVLLGIGFVPMPSNTGYVLSAFSGKKTLYLDQLQSFSPEQFDAYLDTIAGFISESKSSEIKYNAGKERVDALKLIEAYSGQDFIEIGSLSITEWNGLYNKEKAAYDKAIQDKIEAKLKKEKEDAELLKIQEQEKASDKEKWANFISQLSSLKLPVMSNSTYRNKLKIAKEKIDEIINL